MLLGKQHVNSVKVCVSYPENERVQLRCYRSLIFPQSCIVSVRTPSPGVTRWRREQMNLQFRALSTRWKPLHGSCLLWLEPMSPSALRSTKETLEGKIRMKRHHEWRCDDGSGDIKGCSASCGKQQKPCRKLEKPKQKQDSLFNPELKWSEARHSLAGH